MVQCNSIHGIQGDGISVDKPHPVILKDNSVSCNNGSGVLVSGQGKVLGTNHKKIQKFGKPAKKVL